MRNLSSQSPPEIKNLYLGKNISRDIAAVSRIIYKQEALTHTARSVLQEAKEKIGEVLILNEQSKERLTNEDLESLVQSIEKVSHAELSDKERQSVVESLSVSFTDYDILTPFVNNPSINDIIISNYKNISVQVGKENIKTDLRFADDKIYHSFVENLLKRRSPTVSCDVTYRNIIFYRQMARSAFCPPLYCPDTCLEGQTLVANTRKSGWSTVQHKYKHFVTYASQPSNIVK